MLLGGKASYDMNRSCSGRAARRTEKVIHIGNMLSFLKLKKSRSQPYALGATSTATVQVNEATTSTTLTGNQQIQVESLTVEKDVTQKQLQLKTAVCYLPHPDKVHYGGEDAYFLSTYGGGAMGVADGVGGWQDSGVNPAEYSRTFMRLAKAFLEGTEMFTAEASVRKGALVVDPRGALDAAHRLTKVPGSATACVMQLDTNRRTLEAANLGDSGFMVVRNGRVVTKSKSLQHYFDCPLQFGAFPEYVEATDTADQADVYSVPLKEGDFIIAGSDGLWDNCYDDEILALLPSGPEAVQKAAEDIAALARKNAGDNDYMSPYCKEALSQGLDLPWWEKLIGMSFKNGKVTLKSLSGGKMDDITVLLACVNAAKPPVAAGPSPSRNIATATITPTETTTAPVSIAADNGSGAVSHEVQLVSTEAAAASVVQGDTGASPPSAQAVDATVAGQPQPSMADASGVNSKPELQ